VPFSFAFHNVGIINGCNDAHRDAAVEALERIDDPALCEVFFIRRMSENGRYRPLLFSILVMFERPLSGKAAYRFNQIGPSLADRQSFNISSTSAPDGVHHSVILGEYNGKGKDWSGRTE